MQSKLPHLTPPDVAPCPRALLAWLRSDEARAQAQEDKAHAHTKGHHAHKRARKLSHQRAQLAQRVDLSRYIIDNILDRACGQPWHQVHEALNRMLRAPLPASRIPSKFRNHTVITDVTLYDERPHAVHRGELRREHYVCPVNGTLKTAHSSSGRNDKRRRRHRAPRPIWTPDGQQVRWLTNGSHGPGWYQLTLSPIPPRAAWPSTFDLLHHRTLAALDRWCCVPQLLEATLLKANVYTSHTRFLSARDLAPLGLSSRHQPRGPYDRFYRGRERR